MNRFSSVVLTTLIGALISTPSYANPQGANVVHGTVTFDPINASQLNITNSANAIINWQSFGIDVNQITRFIQPSASSAVLNRVIGQDPSLILGQLLSNGRVFLINPNGVVFGQQAVVDTAGLIASTLNMTDQDFLNGKLNFEGDPDSGSIENRGYIKAGENGEIFLIAPNIENSGVIETDGGRVLLAAGEKISITSLDADDIVFDIQAPENTVVNLGEMLTNGGAASVFAGTITHSGAINANSIRVDQQGRIQLVAQADITLSETARLSVNGPSGGTIHIESLAGTTLVAGQISATGDTGKGGQIKILANNVGLLDGSVVDVSGEIGGGEILVGGDLQGKNTNVQNAQFTYMAENAELHADALAAGDGGKVILWADDSTRAYGRVSATGGSESGNGGFIEISGKQGLVFEADVNATASNGESGTLLLDPDTINIINGGGGTDDVGLPVFTAVGVTTISELALEGQAVDVVLQATDGITLEDLADNNLSMSGLVALESITLRVTGAGDITFLDANDSITTAGGNIILEITGGVGNLSNIGNLITAGGDATLTTTDGNIDMQGDLSLTLGAASINTGGTGSVTQNIATSVFSLGKLKVLAGGAIDLQSANQVAQFTGISATNGDIDFQSTQALTLARDGTASAVETGGNIHIRGQNNITINDDVLALGAGDIIVETIGGGSADINVQLGDVIAAFGQVTLQTANGVANANINVGPGSLVQSEGGPGIRSVTLLADNMTIQGSVLAPDHVLAANRNAGVAIDLGSATDVNPNTLELSDTEINNMVAPVVIIGAVASNTGIITVTAPINVASDLELHSNGQGININNSLNVGASRLLLEARGAGSGDGEVRQNASGIITAGLLDVIADQAVLLNAANNLVSTYTSISNGLLNSGTSFTNGATPLTLGTITDIAGDISISSQSDIVIDFDVNATTGNLVLTSSAGNINGDGTTAALRAGSDLTVSASGSIGVTNQVITNTGADLNLSTGGTGASGNIRVEENSAPLRFNTSALTVSTDSVSSQLVDLTFPNGLNVDANLGDSGDNLAIHTPGRDIQEGAGILTANVLTLDSDGGIGGVGALQTAASTIAATVASGGALNLDNNGAVTFTALINNTAGDIKVNQTGGSGAVIVAAPVVSGGQTRIRANAADLTIAANITSPGSVFLDTTTTGNVIVNPGQTVNATGAGSVVDVVAANDAQINGNLQSNASNVNVTASSGQLIMSGPSVITASANASLAANTNVNIGSVNAGGTVAVTATTGSIVDINGAATNITSTGTTALSASNNIGLFADPLETAVPILSLSSNTGEVGIANSGNLQLTNGTLNSTKLLVKTSSGNLTFSPAVNLALATQVTLEAQNNLLLQAGLTANSALLNLGSIAGTLSLNGVGESVSALDIIMAAPTMNINNGATVTSTTNMNINAGNLILDGGAIGSTTKLIAAGTMTFRGNDITLQGGTAANAAVSIDPSLIDISIAGNLNVIAGTGNLASAEILGNSVQITTLGDVNITGSGPNAFARIESLAGNVAITANNVSLNQGIGIDADAIIAANSGGGSVTINSATCSNCVQLASNPFGNSATEAGIFAAVLNISAAVAGPAAAGAAGNELPAVDEILVLDELFKTLEQELTGDENSREEDEDKDKGKPVLVCS